MDGARNLKGDGNKMDNYTYNQRETAEISQAHDAVSGVGKVGRHRAYRVQEGHGKAAHHLRDGLAGMSDRTCGLDEDKGA